MCTCMRQPDKHGHIKLPKMEGAEIAPGIFLIGEPKPVPNSMLMQCLDEFAFRLNEGDVKRHTMQRLDSFIDGVAGKRLTYKALIH